MQPYAIKVVKSFLWQGGAQAAGQIVSWISTLMVVRLLTPADYGLVSLAMLFVGFFYMLADLGFGDSAVQAQELNRQQLRELFGLVMVANVILAVVTFLTSPVIAEFFNEPRLVLIIRVLSINFVLIALFSLPQSMLMRDLDFRTKARADVFATMAAAIISLGMAVGGFGAWALVASTITMNLIRAILYYQARPILLMPAFSVQASRPLIQFGVLLTIDRIFYYFYGQADVAIGGKVLGSQALGIYTVSLTVASMPLGKILPVVTQVAFSAFARIQGDPERVKRNVLRAVQLTALFAFPAMFGLSAIAQDLIPVVLGPEWAGAVAPFQLICLVLPLRAISSVLSPALLGVGRPGVNLFNVAASGTIMSAAFLIGVQFGISGLAMAWLVAYPFAFLITCWQTLRVLQVKPSQFLSVLAWPAAASAVMLAIVTTAAEIAVGWNAVERLAILILLGAASYTAATWLWNRRSIDAIRLVLNN